MSLSSFWTGARDALVLPAWVVGLSMLGVGSLAREVGHPAATAVLSTLLVWASPAQVILYGGLAAGTALPVIAFAILLSSIRFLPMTVTILALLRHPGQALAIQFLAAHYVSVTVWVENLRRLPTKSKKERLPYYFGFANATIGVSALMTGVGFYLAGAVPPLLSGALLFLAPLYFMVSIVAGARGVTDWTAAIFGLMAAPLFARVFGPELDLLAIGLAGGTVAYFVGRRRRALAAG